MKKTTVIFLCAVCACALHGRTFSSKQGDTLEAEYVNVVGDNVILKNTEGKTLTIPIDSFVDKDRDYIYYRHVKDTLGRDGPVQLKMREAKGKVTQTQEPGINISSWEAGYKVTLENTSSLPLKDLVVQYGLFKLAAEAGGKTASSGDIHDAWGQLSVPFIDSKRTFDFETDKMPMRSLKLRSNTVWADGGKRRNTDDLKGLWVRVYWKDILVLEHKSSPSTLADEKWPDKLKAPKTRDQGYRE